MTENLLLFSKLNNISIEPANRMTGLLISTELREKFNANNKIIADVNEVGEFEFRKAEEVEELKKVALH